MNPMKITLFGLLGLVCLMPTPLPAQETARFNTPGNLEATMPLDCGDLDQLTPQHTPADMFHGVWQCVSQGDYDTAIDLMLIARAYGFFDIARIKDSSAHGATQVLQMQVSDAMSPDQHAAWAAASEASAGAQLREGEVCAQLRRLGSPSYFPYYMVQHGLNASVPPDTENALRVDFEPEQAWNSVLVGYECIERTAPAVTAVTPPEDPEEGELTVAGQIDRGGKFASIAKLAVSESWYASSKLPDSTAESGLVEPNWNDGVSVSVGAGGVISIEFAAPPALEGRSMILTPELGEGVIRWTCSSETIPAELLPENCRP